MSTSDPSLFASSLDVYTRLVRNLPEYELTSNTTYEQYVHAIGSQESDIRMLLPPELPEMRLWLRFAHPDFDPDSTAIALVLVTVILRHVILLQTFSRLSTLSGMKSLPTGATYVIVASAFPTYVPIPYI
jgi:hypothetical protein